MLRLNLNTFGILDHDIGITEDSAYTWGPVEKRVKCLVYKL